MDAIAPINFKKVLFAPIFFRQKQGLKGILISLIKGPNGLLGILLPSIEIPNDVPVALNPIWPMGM